METITNDIDIIYSRDIIERIKELKENFSICPHCREGLLEEESINTNKCPDCEQKLLESDEINELGALKNIVDQASGCEDFEHGEGLIHESFFTEYCEQLCEDIGDIPSNLPWYIESNIDWDGVADHIKQDYTEIDFDGVIYFIRD